MTKEWWKNGIQFECQGSGKCCTSHGEFGFVYLTKRDRQRMAKYLKMTTKSFTAQYCQQTNGFWHLIEKSNNGDCQFLLEKQCSIYEARPEQCRTWPFWSEVMSAKKWKQDVASFCPGVGKGRIWSPSEIQEILNSQSEWEQNIQVIPPKKN